MDKPKFVILSTGRAGSGYIAKLLTLAGIPTGHEAYYGIREASSSKNIGESSWLALPRVESREFKGKVFHQVRHPLDVISSLMNGDMQQNHIKPYAHFQQENTHGDYNYDDFLKFSVNFVYDWNERCEQQAQLTWRVEKVNYWHIYYIAGQLDMELNDEQVRRALRKTSTKTNKHSPGPKYKWGDLPEIKETEQLYEQAKRYGYVT